MTHMHHVDDPLARLDDILSTLPNVRGIMLTTERGEVLASRGRQVTELEELGSFIVGMGQLASRVAAESGSGELRGVLVEASAGHVYVRSVGEDRFLFALCSSATAPGLLVSDLSWCASALEHATH